MDKKTCLCFLYSILIFLPTPLYGVGTSKDKKQVQALLPLAEFAGATVSAPIFLALVAAYGLASVLAKGIKESSTDSHPCSYGRGWCRPQCFSHEYIDHPNNLVCGSYVCCLSSI